MDVSQLGVAQVSARKPGANSHEEHRMRQLEAEGHTPEQISAMLNISLSCVVSVLEWSKENAELIRSRDVVGTTVNVGGEGGSIAEPSMDEVFAGQEPDPLA